MIQNEKYIVLDIETDGLCPWFGNRITCICARDSTGYKFVMTDHNELKIIKSFLGWLKPRSREEYFLVTKNGKQFDIPFILTRLAIRSHVNDKNALHLLLYEHLDLHELTKKKVSLNDMARLFKCRLKSGTRKNAIRLWRAERYDDLIKYCMQDVETIEEVYLKWKILK
ncbi:ribonuclease H-like domain-containing protein [Thermodesulfobacteriota bacterium]